MLAAIGTWLEGTLSIRRRWQGDARALAAAGEPDVARHAACALRPAREALAAACLDAKPGTNDGLPAAPLPALLFAAFGSCPDCVGRESHRRERLRAREEEWKKRSWKS
jgi:hypothetical protein